MANLTSCRSPKLSKPVAQVLYKQKERKISCHHLTHRMHADIFLHHMGRNARDIESQMPQASIAESLTAL